MHQNVNAPGIESVILHEDNWTTVRNKWLTGRPEEKFISIEQRDYCNIVVLNSRKEMLLVRQFRIAVEDLSLELPGGLVEKNETPEETAVRELKEETGLSATTDELRLMCKLDPDTGRLTNSYWGYMLQRPVSTSEISAEEGIEVLWVKADKVPQMVMDGTFKHAMHATTALLATRNNKDN